MSTKPGDGSPVVNVLGLSTSLPTDAQLAVPLPKSGPTAARDLECTREEAQASGDGLAVDVMALSKMSMELRALPSQCKDISDRVLETIQSSDLNLAFGLTAASSNLVDAYTGCTKATSQEFLALSDLIGNLSQQTASVAANFQKTDQQIAEVHQSVGRGMGTEIA
jgi:hypothetical protein